MNILLWLLMLVVNFVLAIFFLVRAVSVPSLLLVVSPTALARRFIRRSADGKSKWDINVNAKDLNHRLLRPRTLLLMAGVCLVGFSASQGVAYLWLTAAFMVMLFGEQDRMDERTFEMWTRALAAVSDGVLIAVLCFVTIFRLQVDAFGLLALMFFARELLLVLARRWLASEPEFEPYEEKDGFTVGVVSESEDGKNTTGIKLPKADKPVVEVRQTPDESPDAPENR
jgi:hypothetical protein